MLAVPKSRDKLAHRFQLSTTIVEWDNWMRHILALNPRLVKVELQVLIRGATSDITGAHIAGLLTRLNQSTPSTPDTQLRITNCLRNVFRRVICGCRQLQQFHGTSAKAWLMHSVNQSEIDTIVVDDRFLIKLSIIGRTIITVDTRVS